MKRILFLLLVLSFLPRFTSASSVDKEIKAQIFGLEKRIGGIEQKQNRLLQLESGHYNEIVHLLRDLKSTTVTLPPAAEVPAVEPAAVAQETPESQPETAPAAAAVEAAPPTAETPPETPTAEAASQPAAEAPEAAPTPPVEAPAVVAAVSSAASPSLSDDVIVKFQSRMNRIESWAIFSFLTTIISLIAVVLMFKNLRQKEQNLKTAIWKTDMQGLREEVMMGRPHLLVEKSYDRITLLNKGSVAASDVQFSLGHAPATMKQKLKSIAMIRPNEKAEVELGQIQEGQWHCKLEYKNAQNGRLYKDQFVMKIDGVTGEIIPMREVV